MEIFESRSSCSETEEPSVAKTQPISRDPKGMPKVGCLFAGIGGFARAAQEAGMTVAWANEKDHFAVETFRGNFEIKPFHKPVEYLSVEGDALEPVDILTAGFPCQPFSIAGAKRGLADERGQLFLQIIRIIKEFAEKYGNKAKPKILILENVKNFRDHDKGRTFQRVQVEIQKAGYWFGDKDAKILNTMTHTDIPQNRERIFMVAFSIEQFSCNTFRFPAPLPGGSTRPIDEFLDLHKEAPSEYYFRPGDRYYRHFADAMENGEADAVYLLRRSYVRQNKSGVCFTLMANMGEGGHNHPVIRDNWGIRKLLPRECARLQGFTDDWFHIPEHMSRSQISKQLGNTVTIPLARRLSEECLAQLERYGLNTPGREKDGMVLSAE